MVDAGTEGRLIAITSVHEHQPRVGSAPYDAAKHGLGGLMKTLALELGRNGITANSVAPGEIATPMTDQEDVDPHGVERPGVPLGRPGDARESRPWWRSWHPCAVVRDRRLVGGGRRDASDGPAGRLQHPERPTTGGHPEC